ncbi:MAG: hypothetical protein Q7U18_13780 [Methylobacter sp.]|nr:hypothetical protein [Methylobacter sp.]
MATDTAVNAFDAFVETDAGSMKKLKCRAVVLDNASIHRSCGLATAWCVLTFASTLQP